MRTPRPPHTCFLRRYDTLQRILGDVEFLGERRSFSTAAKRFGEFRLSLEQHFKDEEEVLLPHFASHAPEPQATLEAIHVNRARVLASMDQVAATITRADHQSFCEAMNSLDEALEAHRAEEEHVVHPALEGILKNDADWESLCVHARFAGAPTTEPSEHA